MHSSLRGESDSQQAMKRSEAYRAEGDGRQRVGDDGTNAVIE